jgi:ribosomal protein S18 acetylase RimI-like enzyme
MLEYARDRAEARGCRFVQALLRSSDRQARRLYEQFGFAVTPQELWRQFLTGDQEGETPPEQGQ